MKVSAVLSLNPELITTLIINSMTVLVVLFAPALAHLLSFPVFYVEPLRIMLIVVLVQNNMENAPY